MKALVVEDTLTTQMILNEQLSAYGDCVAVSNGADAIEEFQKALRKTEKAVIVITAPMMLISICLLISAIVR